MSDSPWLQHSRDLAIGAVQIADIDQGQIGHNHIVAVIFKGHLLCDTLHICPVWIEDAGFVEEPFRRFQTRDLWHSAA